MVKKEDLFKSAEQDIAVLTRKPEKHDIFLDGAKKGIRHGTAGIQGARSISISRITPDEKQIRKIDKSDPTLKELADSIKAHGVLQPINAYYRDDHDDFRIITGHRRYMASKMAGLKEIPCIMMEEKPEDKTILMVQLVENLQREDLNPIDEAAGIKRLLDEFKLTHEDAAQWLGKSRTYITKIIRLNDLPPKIKEECATSHNAEIPLNKDKLLQVARQKTEQEQTALWTKIKSAPLTTGQVRKEAKKDIPKKGRPHNYNYTYRPPDKAFSVSVSFPKAQATTTDVKEALKAAIKNIK